MKKWERKEKKEREVRRDSQNGEQRFFRREATKSV